MTDRRSALATFALRHAETGAYLQDPPGRGLTAAQVIP